MSHRIWSGKEITCPMLVPNAWFQSLLAACEEVGGRWGGGGGFCVTKRTHCKLQALLPELQLPVRLGIHLPAELPSLPRTYRPQWGNPKSKQKLIIIMPWLMPGPGSFCHPTKFVWYRHCIEYPIYIPRNETSRPRSQFLHSCICERFIYPRIVLPIWLQ
jgi:hypothetical protein